MPVGLETAVSMGRLTWRCSFLQIASFNPFLISSGWEENGEPLKQGNGPYIPEARKTEQMPVGM